MQPTTLLGLLLTAVLLVGGCSVDGPNATPENADSVVAADPTQSAPPPTSGSNTPGSVVPLSTAPSAADSGAPSVADTLVFTGETLDGDTFDGAQLAGTPTVLWFWAPWCPTCRAQVDGVEAIAAEHQGKVNVVGVGGLSDAEAIRDFAKGVAGPTHLIDEAGSVWRHFGITAQSVYVLLDADGMVVEDGYLDNDGLKKAVANLVG